MVSVTKRYLLHDKTRNALSMIAVSLSMLLIFTLIGLYSGTYQQADLFLVKSGADLWVTQQGASNFYFSISFLPASVGESISGLSGVVKASPFLYQAATLSSGGASLSVYYFGYDNSTGGLGGPWDLTQGSGVTQEHQIVVDRTVASRLGLHIGSEISLQNTTFSVAGISSGTAGITAPYVFLGINEAARLAGEANFVNFYLVRVSPGQNLSVISSEIRSLPYVSVHTSANWITASRNAVLADIGPTLEGMVLIGGLTGTLIIALTNYVSAADRQKEFGIMKALGIRNSSVTIIVFNQSIIIALAAFVMGAALTGIVALALSYVVHFPLTIALGWTDVLEVLALAIIIGAVAAIIPARMVSRVDPATAFK